MGVLTLHGAKSRLRDGATVLFLCGDSIEEGAVIFVHGDRIDLVWLEGHKSRNETVTMNEILAIADRTGDEQKFPGWSGKGHLTPAGERWLKEHP